MVGVVLDWDRGGGGSLLPFFNEEVSGSGSEPGDCCFRMVAGAFLAAQVC